MRCVSTFGAKSGDDVFAVSHFTSSLSLSSSHTKNMLYYGLLAVENCVVYDRQTVAAVDTLTSLCASSTLDSNEHKHNFNVSMLILSTTTTTMTMVNVFNL